MTCTVSKCCVLALVLHICVGTVTSTRNVDFSRTQASRASSAGSDFVSNGNYRGLLADLNDVCDPTADSTEPAACQDPFTCEADADNPDSYRCVAEAPPTPAEAPPTPAEAPPTPAETPPTPAEAPPTPADAPPTPAEAPPTPAEAPPTPADAPPTPADAPPTPADAPPTPAEAPPTPADAPPTPADAPPTPADAPPTPAEAPPTPADAPPTPADAPPTPAEAPPTPDSVGMPNTDAAPPPPTTDASAPAPAMQPQLGSSGGPSMTPAATASATPAATAASVFSTALTVPAITSVAALSAYATVQAFDTTEQTRFCAVLEANILKVQGVVANCTITNVVLGSIRVSNTIAFTGSDSAAAEAARNSVATALSSSSTADYFGGSFGEVSVSDVATVTTFNPTASAKSGAAKRGASFMGMLGSLTILTVSVMCV